MLFSQFSSLVVVAVTASAGTTMAAPAAPMALNCMIFVPTRPPTARMMIRVVMENFWSMVVRCLEVSSREG